LLEITTNNQVAAHDDDLVL